MRLVGLDIDGVLSNHEWARMLYNTPYPDNLFQRRIRQLDPRCVGRLNTIVEETDAHFVITSSWRKHGVDLLRKYLEARGFKHSTRILDVLPPTPPPGWCAMSSRRDSNRWFRGLETEIWILQNITDVKDVRLVFLDDDSDFGRLRDACWVRTTLFSGPECLDPVKYNYAGPYNGLQDDHVRQVREQFEGQTPTAGTIILGSPHPQLTVVGRRELYSSR